MLITKMSSTATMMSAIHIVDPQSCAGFGTLKTWDTIRRRRCFCKAAIAGAAALQAGRHESGPIRRSLRMSRKLWIEPVSFGEGLASFFCAPRFFERQAEGVAEVRIVR